MIRLTIFIIALLLAVEAIDPDAPWLITLAVLSGIELVRIGPFRSGRRFSRRVRRWVDRPFDDDW